VIDEGDVPSLQCKIGLRGPKSVRKVVGLSLICIEFYVPAFTPRLNSIETSLQLSENTTFFCHLLHIYTGVISKPCGTPACISPDVNISPSAETLNFL
jgi:hypothetical protein